MGNQSGVDEEYLAHKEKLSKGNKTVRAPIGRIGKEAVQLKGGRKKEYTPTRMLNACNRYFKWCEDHDEMPNIKGMMLKLGLTRTMFYTYMSYPGFGDIMEQAKVVIKEWAERDVWNTPGQCAGKIAYMKNVHDWSEQIRTENRHEVRQIENPEQARAKLAQLVPGLLEAFGDGEALEKLLIEYGDDSEVQDAEFVEVGNEKN